MVFLVTYVDKSKGICCDAPGVVKLAVPSALTAERSQETSGWIKYLKQSIIILLVKMFQIYLLETNEGN